jgi:putative spermidine/putrescine transport system ATP-binding protein
MMIAGFIIPSRGSIHIQDKDITFIPANKRDVGMVFQNYALFPHMTVFENIAFPLKIRRMPKTEIKKEALAALELVKLPGHGNRYPNQLSGGQQQRIAMARAIVLKPRVLLMDEPLGALDKKLREHMQLELKQLQRKLNITVIYVTHDQGEALTMSDRVAVMKEGKPEQIGPPEALYEKPANRFVAEFIGESNFLSAKVIKTEGAISCVRLEDSIDLFVPAKQGLEEGQQVDLTIRPERILAGSLGADERNSIEGIIEEVIYAGEIIKYGIRLGKSNLVFLKQPNSSYQMTLRSGERIRLSWKLEDMTIISR